MNPENTDDTNDSVQDVYNNLILERHQEYENSSAQFGEDGEIFSEENPSFGSHDNPLPNLKLTRPNRDR